MRIFVFFLIFLPLLSSAQTTGGGCCKSQNSFTKASIKALAHLFTSDNWEAKSCETKISKLLATRTEIITQYHEAQGTSDHSKINQIIIEIFVMDYIQRFMSGEKISSDGEKILFSEENQVQCFTTDEFEVEKKLKALDANEKKRLRSNLAALKKVVTRLKQLQKKCSDLDKNTEAKIFVEQIFLLEKYIELYSEL